MLSSKPPTPVTTRQTRLFHNKQGKIIGALHPDGIFVKRVSKTRHYMRNFDAWGIEAYVRDTIESECTTIRIYELDHLCVWETPFRVFQAKAFSRDFSTPQWFLERKYWRITNSEEKVLQERAFLREELEERQTKLPL